MLPVGNTLFEVWLELLRKGNKKSENVSVCSKNSIETCIKLLRQAYGRVGRVDGISAVYTLKCLLLTVYDVLHCVASGSRHAGSVN